MKKYLVFIGWLMVALSVHAQNVLPNGDFEQSDPANPVKPLHWELPDGLGIRWAAAPDVPGAPPHGKALRMDTAVSEVALVENREKMGLKEWVFPHPKGNEIAKTYGLSFYSDAIPAEPGKAYRVSFDYMSEKGTAGKVWLRGYGKRGEKMMRLYEAVMDCKSKGTWQRFSEVFHPTKHRPEVTEFKLMLFTYFPPGVCWFDNVTVEPIPEQ